MTQAILSVDPSAQRAVFRPGVLILGGCALVFACGSPNSSAPKRCSSDADCGLAQGCDLDDPNDGYCTTLCVVDTDCPVQQACAFKAGEVYESSCDDQGEHTKGKGICDKYDGKYGPNSCQAEADRTRPVSGGSNTGSSGGGMSMASAGSTSTSNVCSGTCADPTPRDPLRISGLETGYGLLDPLGGRDGGWFIALDAQGSTIEPASAADFEPQCGGAGGSCYAACFAGTLSGTNYPFAMLALTFHANNAAYDVSSYSGITFSVYGYVGASSKFEFKVPTSAVLPPSDGGTCSGVCYDDFNIDLSDLTPQTFAARDVPFSTLKQDGFGMAAAWDPTTATGLEWHVTSKLASVSNEKFLICVDEVRFSSGAGT